MGHTTAMMNLQSAGLVLMGTLVSVLLAYSMKNLKALWASLRRIFSKEHPDYALLARQVEFLAYKTRRYGAKSLEEDLKKIEQPFLRKGMELVMDGMTVTTSVISWSRNFEVYLAGRESQTNILGTMSKLAPVFGFAGTIIGLINILSNIGEPSQIGQGMAVALLTTFYGLMFGNLLFMPLSKKLNEITRAEAAVFYTLLDGITDITEEKNSKPSPIRCVPVCPARPDSRGPNQGAGGKSGGKDRGAGQP